MELEILGWPPDGPKLRLDHERFSYAGKFVMTNTGKAVARADENQTADLIAAASFNEDRTDDSTLWIRYVTVARQMRGQGIGPELAAFVRDRAVDRGYRRVRIAVNNPFAYEALYRAEFGFTGETTGLAELVLEYVEERDLEWTEADNAEQSPAIDGDNSESADGVDETGPFDRTNGRYREGLELFAERELSEAEERFLEKRLD